MSTDTEMKTTDILSLLGKIEKKMNEIKSSYLTEIINAKVQFLKTRSSNAKYYREKNPYTLLQIATKQFNTEFESSEEKTAIDKKYNDTLEHFNTLII